MTISLRPGTDDRNVWQEVVEGNCYNLPDDLSGQHIIDIGADFGAFSVLCLERGARLVQAFEMKLANYLATFANLAKPAYAGRALVTHAAVWGAEPALLREEGGLGETPAGDKVQGGTNVTPADETHPASVYGLPLDWILRSEGSPVDILKLDCEGAEYRILYESELLPEYVRRIVMEWHGNDESFPQERRSPGGRPHGGAGLQEYLAERGYTITRFIANTPKIGYLEAVQRG